MEESIEYSLAKSLLSPSLRLFELRVLVMGGYQFSIARPEEEDEDEAFRDSERDPVQSASIIRDLDAGDWAFLTDLPPSPCEQDPYATAFKPGAGAPHSDSR